MSLAPFDVYCAEASDRFQVRRWLLRAIILSLALHAALLAVFQFTKLENFRFTESVPPAPTMTFWHVMNLPDAAETETRSVPTVEPMPVVPIPIPVETPREQTPGIPSRPVEVLPLALGVDTPTGIGGIDVGAGFDAQAALENQLRDVASGLMEKGERVNSDLATQASPETKDLAGGTDSAAGLPERQTFEKLLQNPGPLPAGGAAIEVPGGALFEYNSFELRPEALEQLGQLGEFIQRHPDATVSIEGHSDAIGTPEYNQTLSEKRAESVRLWFVQKMGIAPERIQTRGFGSTQLRVPADGTIEQQQPNRRVEIVIKTTR